MATKSLIRIGASLMNRMLLSNSIFQRSPRTDRHIVSHGLEITPQLFTSLSKFQNSLHLPQNDAHSVNRLANELWPPFSPLLLARCKATQEGRRVIARRIAKGRSRITALHFVGTLEK